MTKRSLDKLLEKKAQINAQIQAAKARDRTQKRKDDTRRKIIAGALALEHAERNPDSEFTRIMLNLIASSTTRPTDRALFDLNPLPVSNDTAKPKGPLQALRSRFPRS